MPSPHTRSAAVAVAACTFAVQAAQGSGLQRRVQFFPAGSFRSGDVRPEEVPAWRIDAASAAAVIARFGARAKPMVVDYEHQTLNKEKNGQPAPAAGWPKSLEWVEGQGLFGVVEMTQRAADHIDAGEYRFFSPVFSYSKTDGTVLDVVMGALTNDPGIQGMQPLSLMAAATAAFLPPETESPVNPLLKALLAALGLPETTTEDAAIAALKDLGPLKPLQERAEAAMTALALPADAAPDAVIAACTGLRAAGTPDPAKFVPVGVVEELRTSIAAMTSRQLSDDVEAKVSAGLADGRLLPAMESWARDLGKNNLAALTSYLATAQPIAALVSSQTKGKEPGKTAGAAPQLTPEQLAVCTAMGMTPEAFATGAPATA